MDSKFGGVPDEVIGKATRRLRFSVSLCVWVLVFWAARLALVLAVADVFGYGEEFAKGAVAKTLLANTDIPYHALPYAYHEGGGFVVSHLLALAFVLLGESVVAVKLTALAVSTALLAVAFRFVWTWISPLAAHCFALLFVFCAASFQRYSVLNLGTHFEALFFAVLALYFTLRLAPGVVRRPTRHEDPQLGQVEQAPGGPSQALLLGLVSGLGLYFALTNASALIASALWLFIAWRGRILRRESFLALAGFAVGALPMALMALSVGSRFFVVRGEVPDKAHTGLEVSLHALLAPLEAAEPGWIAVAALVAAAGVVALMRVRRDACWLVTIYALVHVVAFVTSGMAIYMPAEALGTWLLYQRLTAVWFAALVLAAAGCACLIRRGGWPGRAALWGMALCLAMGVGDLARLVMAGRPSEPRANLARLASTPGYLYREYFELLSLHLDGGLNEQIGLLLKLDEPPGILVPALASTFLPVKAGPIQPSKIFANLNAFGKHRRLALLGLGARLHGRGQRDIGAAFERLAKLPGTMPPELAEGLGRFGLGLHFTENHLELLRTSPVPGHWSEAWWRGVGWRAHYTFRFRPDLAEAWISTLGGVEAEWAKRGFRAAREQDTLN